MVGGVVTPVSFSLVVIPVSFSLVVSRFVKVLSLVSSNELSVGWISVVVDLADVVRSLRQRAHRLGERVFGRSG